MVKAKELTQKQIVVAPFCTDSVLMYHQLELENIKTDGFFDRNPLMQNRQYGDVYISQMYYRANTNIILCGGNYNEEIKKQLLSVGYAEDAILFAEDVELCFNKYDAAEKVDVEKFAELMPRQVVIDEGCGVLKIRKLQRLKQLGAPTTELTYEKFEGLRRKDTYKDEDGVSHLCIKRIEIDVTSKCSLKCKHCGALMQYFCSPYDIPAEEVISDYNRMLELIEFTDDVLVMGGEPFVYQELAKVITAIKLHPETEKKVGMVRIVTNGTIVPKDDVLDVLADSNIVVWISNYREHSRHINELIRVFQQRGIKYSVLDLLHWANVQQLVERDEPLSTEELLEKRKKCAKRHHAVSEGKFYLCAFTNFAHKLKAVPYDESSFVDIYAEDAKERLVEYLDTDRPLPISCSWCNGNYPERWTGDGLLPVAEQSKEVLPYKKFE